MATIKKRTEGEWWGWKALPLHPRGGEVFTATTREEVEKKLRPVVQREISARDYQVEGQDW